jgi:multiple sugar transport system permease protein
MQKNVLMRNSDESVLKYRKSKIKRFLFGSYENSGFLVKLALYFVLIVISYIYLFPLITMLVTSFMSVDDLVNDSVHWIPTKLALDNFKQAFEVMDFGNTISDTLQLSVLPSLCQVVICCFTGYAFSRYRFKGKAICWGLLILTFVLPSQATMIPTYLIFNEMDIIGTVWAFVLPAVLGQGFKSTIITLVFYLFFSQISTSQIEAASLDGCGHFKVFFYIALPCVGAAFIIGFLFSLVWYWNETYLTNMYISNSNIGHDHSMTTLLVKLTQFEAAYKLLNEGEGDNTLNEAIRMAGTVICITPLLTVYFILQKYFVQSVDMVGLKD